MLEFSEDECKWIMDAFHTLQCTDLLKNGHLILARKIMDEYPGLAQQYKYLYNRYQESASGPHTQ